MKRLALAVIAAALIWSGWWFWQAQATRSTIETWFEARRAEGWQASYDDLAIRGFPSRVDATFTGIELTAPDGNLHWQAPSFQSLRLIYNLDHHIFAFPPTMVIGDATVTSDGLRASLVEDGGAILRANVEAVVLNVASPARSFALAGLSGGMAQTDGQPDHYRMGMVAEALAGPDGPTQAAISGDGLQIQADVTFDNAWRAGALETQRPQPKAIKLDFLTYQLGDLTLKLAGALQVDADGRGDGELTLRAENWRSLLDRARGSGQMPAGVAGMLVDGLDLYANLTGTGKDLDLPLRFDQGKIKIGPVPLGEGPRFRLP